MDMVKVSAHVDVAQGREGGTSRERERERARERERGTSRERKRERERERERHLHHIHVPLFRCCEETSITVYGCELQQLFAPLAHQHLHKPTWHHCMYPHRITPECRHMAWHQCIADERTRRICHNSGICHVTGNPFSHLCLTLHTHLALHSLHISPYTSQDFLSWQHD